MRLRTWPSGAAIVQADLAIEAHSRGATDASGLLSYERAPGARWRGSLTVAAMGLTAAFAFRAFLHSLRGRSGSFLLAAPTYAQATSANTLTSAGSLTEYTDDFRFSDGTAYSDTYGPTYSYLSADAADSADGITVTRITGVTHAVGNWLFVGSTSGPGQLCRIVSVSVGSTTWTLGIRPRLRQAYASGAVITFASVTAPFRLEKDTPAVAIVAGARSMPVQLEIEEAY